MEKAIGVVRFRPAPDYDRLRAVMQEDPREVVPQGKHFLSHAPVDPMTQALTYNLMCYTAACVLRRSEVEAVFHGHEAVRLCREVPGADGKRLLFDSLVNLGTAAERIGEYRRAIEAYREAVALPLAWLGRAPQEEAVLTYLARASYFKGDYDEALTFLDQAEVLAVQRQDPFSGETLHSLRGRCHLRIGDYETAEAYLSRAAAITNDESRYELRPKGRILSSLGILKACRHEFDTAEEYAQAALEIGRDVEDPHARAEGQMVLALVARNRRRVQEAVGLSANASRIAFDYGYVPLIQEVVWLMGHLFPEARG